MPAKTVRAARLERVLKTMSDDYHAEWCGKYGEPGYSDPERGVILANWNDVPKYETLILERAGFETEWSDEWVIDYNNDKAYRTSPDSYGWRASALLPPEWCEYLFPDDGADAAIKAFASDSASTVGAVPYWVTDDDLTNAGFVLHAADYESGLHPGQNDNPKKIAAELLKHGGKAARVVCRVDNSGQFDCRFSVWYEPAFIESEESQ